MADIEEQPEVIDFTTMSKRKKGKKSKKKEEQKALDNDALYADMLARIFDLLRNKKSGGTETKRGIVVKQPEVVRFGTKKSAWINFQEICDILRRSNEHLSKFIFVELGTKGSIAGGSQLILKGRFMEKQIENLLKKYITEYVLCQMCKCMNTSLERDPSIRAFTMKCENCGSTRSVNPIKEGYTAVSKGDRKKAKMNA
jgi:translation initiation factor 2 subunit 2